MRTRTVSSSTLIALIVPTPSGVMISRPTRGMRLRVASYWSCSYLRQHISLSHRPEIFVGLSERLCSLAILMDTGVKSPRNVRQQMGRPQGPMPPSIFASSRTPIWRSSMRVLKMLARFLTSMRKSTRPFAVK